MNTILLLALLACPQAETTAQGQSEFGVPVTVNGVLIEDVEIKRHIIYGPCRPALEWRRINALLVSEINRRAAAGEPTDHLAPSEEEFDAIYQKKIDEFVERFPTLDVAAEVRRAYRNMDWYRRELQMDLVFDNTYIADNPEQWPAITFEALRAEADEILIDDFRQSYERRTNFYAEALATWEEAKATYPDRVAAYEVELAEWERRRVVTQPQESGSGGFLTGLADSLGETQAILLVGAVVALLLFGALKSLLKFGARPSALISLLIGGAAAFAASSAVSQDAPEVISEAAPAPLDAQPAPPEEPGDEPEFPQEDTMYRSILRQMVRDMLFKTAETKTAVDGLPAEIVMTLDINSNGTVEHTWRTDDLWEDVKDTVSEKEIEEAKHFLAKLEAARQRMTAEQFLISEDQAHETFSANAEGAGFQSAQFNIGMVAVGNHQFPSVEAYGEYFRVLESHRLRVAPTIENPEQGGLAEPLREHLVRANKIMGLGQVDCEVLLVSAFDFAGNQWMEGGWTQSKERADWLKSEIEKNNLNYAEYRRLRMEAAAAGGELDPNQAPQAMDPHDFWSLLIDEYCGYWDPPQPAKGRPGSAVGYKQKGRFGERYRNDLQGMIGESPYHQFVRGFSITDFVFFEQQIGTIAGPFKGPHGYYLTKVMRRTPPTRPLNVADERHVGLLRDDYIPFSLIGYCEEAFEAAEVEGI